MILKETKICCAFAWSPAATQSPQPMIAAGSVAGAMGDDFSSDSHLEIRLVDLNNNTTTEMPMVGHTYMADRVYRIDWSSHFGEYGLIAGGFPDGTVSVWSVDTLLSNYQTDPSTDTVDPVVARIQAHQGHIRGCHFNPLQPHFLATGGLDRELCIWSLQDPSEPQAVPACTKSTHPTEITNIRWNPKFAHILGTTTTGGTVSVWDLKARRAALTFQVAHGQSTSATTLAWHPEISTHVAVARDDPTNPVIQIWDLKKAMSPIRELRAHTKGITGLSWCAEDPSLILSCGCDGRTICWNQTTGDIVGEFPQQDTWIYDVQWATRIPAVIGSASFDSSLTVMSAQSLNSTANLKGGSHAGTGENFSGSSGGAAPAPRAAPKWLKRPCGATFGLGGRIAMLSGSATTTAPNSQTEQQNTRSIRLTRLPTIKCDNTASNTAITATGGFSSTELIRTELSFRQLFSSVPPEERPAWMKSQKLDVIAAATKSTLVGTREPLLDYLNASPVEAEAAVNAVPTEPYALDESDFEKIMVKCIVSGKVSEAVNLCITAGRFDDAFATALLKGPEEVRRVHAAYVEKKTDKLRFVKYLGAVIANNYDPVKLVGPENEWQNALALIATYVHRNNFAAASNALGDYLLKNKVPQGALAAYVSSANLNAAADTITGGGSSQDPFYPPQQIVHAIYCLEQVVRTECTAPSFADALATYADQLAKAGNFDGALAYAARATKLGDSKAAVIADRVQFHVSPQSRSAVMENVPCPFTVIPLPDANSMECQMMASHQRSSSGGGGGGGVAAVHGGGHPPTSTAHHPTHQHHQHAPVEPSQDQHGTGRGALPTSAQQQQHQQQPQQQQQQRPTAQGGNRFGAPQTAATSSQGVARTGGAPQQQQQQQQLQQQQQQQQHPATTVGRVGQPMTMMPPMGATNAQPTSYPSRGGAAHGAPQQQPPQQAPAPPFRTSNNVVYPPTSSQHQDPQQQQQQHVHQGPTGGVAGTGNYAQQPSKGNTNVNLPPPPLPSPPTVGGLSSHGGAPPPPPQQTRATAPPPHTAPNNINPPTMTSATQGGGVLPSLSAVPPPQGGGARLPSLGSVPVLKSSPSPPSLGGSAKMTAPPPPSSAVSSSASSTVQLSTFNIQSIPNAARRPIAEEILKAIPKVTDKRKREAIEKSAAELLDRLVKNSLDDVPAAVLLEFAIAIASGQSAAAKEQWRKFADAHFDIAQSIINLKFLA